MRWDRYMGGLLVIFLLLLFTALPVNGEERGSACAAEAEELMEVLRKRSQVLDRREEELRMEEERLKELETELETRIAELRRIRQQIDEALAELRSIEKERLLRLAKLFENMAPEEAAARIDKLEPDLAIQLLQLIKARKAGKILAAIEPDKAAELSQRMGTQRLLGEKDAGPNSLHN